MSIVPIRDLEPFQSGKKIQIRVCRKWRPKIFRLVDQFMGLHCIFVDAMGDAIEASVKEVDYDLVAPKIEDGCHYEITYFYTVKSKSSFQVVPHPAQIYLNTRTVFKKLLNVHSPIQRHRFYLQDFDSLSSRIDNDSILTDVLGHITAMQPLEEKIIADGRIEKKCEIYIENLRKKAMRVTLWGDIATSFNSNAFNELTSAKFVVFTSLKVKKYEDNTVLSSTISTMIFMNPDILELEQYKSMFNNPIDTIKMVPASTTQQIAPQQLKTTKRLSVGELNILDPDKCKDVTIISRATITRFDTHNGWWYKACPSCYKQLKTNLQTDQLVCPNPKHGVIDQIPIPWFKVGLILEDASDQTNAIIIGRSAEQLFKISCRELVVEKGFANQQEFPEAILRVKGQCKVFQFRFGNMKSNFNRSDLLIQGVFDDKVELLASSSELTELDAKMLTLAPSPLSKQVSPLDLIASPDTPPIKITSISKKRTRDDMTRAILSSIKKARRKLERSVFM
ncbi:hypothetical protein M0R45_027978 [Rubus argutus]|uniref:Replication protein A 70 kDa DNA-binding subunit B/D first OB fold domain-containing protein n=1 Tax=Rubus argutus TaxID=59490 RepID=A0AAW1W5U9_RUBAR